VRVNHHPRKFGRAKYGLERTLKVVLDLFVVKFLSSYASKPIYLFGGFGIGMMTLGGGVLLFLFIRRLAGISVLQSPLFAVGIMVFLMGFQSAMMGLIAELLARTYHESQGKPTYTVRRIIETD